MNEVRCPVCNALNGKMVFGLAQFKCRKCSFVFVVRFDTNETVNVRKNRDAKAAFPD